MSRLTCGSSDVRTLKRYLGRKVIINIAEGSERAFSGTLTSVRGDVLVLRDATLIDPRGGDLSGSVIIPIALVVWVQVV